jgi:hypothetical protein
MLLSAIMHLDYAVLLALAVLATSLLSSLIGMWRELKTAWKKS